MNVYMLLVKANMHLIKSGFLSGHSTQITT